MNLTRLRRLHREGRTPTFVYFWGHRSTSSSLDLACFSQWWPAPFVVDGVRFPTAEHHMMVAKARLFADVEAEAEILATESPSEAKAIGRRIVDFDETVWAEHRRDAVFDGNLAKFQQHPELADVLLLTGEAVLVEASPYDRVWGIGLASTDPRAADPLEWPGLNLLGFVLMDVRDELRRFPG